MITASYRFYAELNDFLPAFLRQRRFRLLQRKGSTIMEMIDILNIPRTEVDLILLNGEPADFSNRVQADDLISVYPLFRSINVSPFNRIKRT